METGCSAGQSPAVSVHPRPQRRAELLDLGGHLIHLGEQLLIHADRGQLLLRLGKPSQARKDLGAVYADDPDYRDVRRLLNTGA